MGNIELREDEEDEKEGIFWINLDDEGDDMEEYGDEIQIPVEEEIWSL